MKYSRRLGRFVINTTVIEEDSEAVYAVMGQCIPVRAEQMYEHDGIEYLAISDQFDPVPYGVVVPEYVANITRTEGEPIEVTFTRK
jgi:hypothetical protein